MANSFYEHDSVMICSGKYNSYIASFHKYSECKKYAIVKVDLSPERIIRTIRLLSSNLIKY